MVAAIHKIAQGDLVKGAVPFEDDMDRGHHCAKFSISICAASVFLEILLVFVCRLYWTSTRTSPPPHCCSCPTLACGKELVFLRSCCAVSDLL